MSSPKRKDRNRSPATSGGKPRRGSSRSSSTTTNKGGANKRVSTDSNTTTSSPRKENSTKAGVEQVETTRSKVVKAGSSAVSSSSSSSTNYTTKPKASSSSSKSNKMSRKAATYACVFAWFTLNLALGPLMKWSYTNTQLCFGYSCTTYNFPIFITAVHMLCCFVLTGPIVVPKIIAGHGAKGTSSSTSTTASASILPLQRQLLEVAPLALMFAVSVGMGNVALVYVYPSFSQMISTTTPLITMVMHMLFSNARYNTWAMVSVPILSGGFLLCYQNEANYHYIGVVCSLLAAVFRAGKSIIQAQVLEDGQKTRIDSLTLLFYMAPYSLAFLLVISAMLEGAGPYTSWFQNGEVATGAGVAAFAVGSSGVMACVLNISNFLVTYYTGPVVLQILGNVKTVFGIAVSILVFGNKVAPEQWLGACICVFGCIIFQQKGVRTDKRAIASSPSTDSSVETELNKPPGGKEDGTTREYKKKR
ncbi:unnamed protein product [Amoebophrya sp. A25]|nr:unnamed protein product [Amoebophrya sp. A25]|eukprot:GSA25T00012451001.1